MQVREEGRRGEAPIHKLWRVGRAREKGEQAGPLSPLACSAFRP